MTTLNYRHVLCIILGVLIIPVYLAACVLSVFKAHRDRKAIKARNEARRLAHPLPAAQSNPVDIIANEVRANRWHRRHSSIASARVQSLLNVANSPNKAGHEDFSFYYTDNLDGKKDFPGNENVGRSRDDVGGNIKAVENNMIYSDEREEMVRAENKRMEETAFGSSSVNSGLRDKGKTQELREIEAMERIRVEEKAKNRLESLRGVDNPAVHIRDESPYGYDSSEQWVRNGSGALEMVNIANRDYHHQLKSQREHSPIKHQRYIFHPARASREDLTDVPLANVKTARLARFDSDESAESTPAHELRAYRAGQAHQKPPRQHQIQQQSPYHRQPQHQDENLYQRQHQTRQQQQQQQVPSRRELDYDHEQSIHEKRRYRQDQSHFYNEEIDLSPRRLLTTMSSSRSGDASYVYYSREGRYNVIMEASRRYSYASALDRNEENLYFAPSRSRSVADLSSSNGVGHLRRGRSRDDPYSLRYYGRVNNAFSNSMEQGRFVDF
ncbi:hypothetical protein EGW08_020861 [Elysia chlorotica]|uniref:Uncharacterized protein n=1 Tax=Elysia chlorotica TaxID=188477 RepID=A0A433SQ65_ELYCH|nr:hypothetical protein EGW08_020861 [Elysia chlorotica]